ncbi:MAG: D-alanyl-D-alanine carboxypeptidase family protein [Methylococcales bacterium]|nr:D-alanyl-D-alanine carboxypeptidase family protein [Methylococcales bacterium]
MHSLNLRLFYLLFGLLSAVYSPATWAADSLLIPASPSIAAKSHVLIDADSGKVLAENSAHQRLPPASLTKIMAVYVIFQEIKKGHLNLDEKVTISHNAWRTPGSRMFVEVNTQVRVEDLLKGVIIQSGNDASVALAEHIAGDETTFAQMMNQEAKRLGLNDTQYRNSMGLPDPEHYTTAHDLSLLTRALIRDFPEYYPWFAEKTFTYNGITQRNRNRLLWRDATVDGVKTGHTEAAGFCLVTSALRDGMRLISVVMGADSDAVRARENQNLLNYGYRFYETHKLYEAGATLSETRIWKGAQTQLAVGLAEDLFVTIPRRHYQDLKAEMTLEPLVSAPIAKGATVGQVQVTLAGEPLLTQNLVALTDVAKGNWFRQLLDSALLYIQ